MAAEARAMTESLEQAASRPGASCNRALGELRRFRGPLLIDLDETLYLRNSTEDFIDTARPALLALLLMRLLDVVRPWRWTGGERTRDVWRVRGILLLLPWTRSAWNKRCVRLAASATNLPLMGALEDRARAGDCEPPIIVTVGFEAIVRPLVNAFKFAQAPRVVATRHFVFSDRAGRAKLALTTRALGAATIERALVITDSDQDADLLDVCAVPLLIKWPQARCRPALPRRLPAGPIHDAGKASGELHQPRHSAGGLRTLGTGLAELCTAAAAHLWPAVSAGVVLGRL